MIHTLALHAIVIPSLSSSIHSQSSAEAATRGGEVLRLLVTVQNIAKLTLILHRDDPRRVDVSCSMSCDTALNEQGKKKGCEGDATGQSTGVPARLAGAKALTDAETLHSLLQRLESVVLAASRRVYEALVGQVVIESGGADVTALRRNSSGSTALTPCRAARLILDLDSLQLLGGTRRDTAKLLDQLIPVIFPPLRNNTHEMLQSKLRQSSLLAFTTRRHRHALARQFGEESLASGSWGGGSAMLSPSRAEAYLHGTVVQQARLQQRQMAAALREKYLTEVQQSVIVQLAQSLPLYDGLMLLQILATHASQMPVAQRCRELASRRMCAVVYAAEAVLMSALSMRRRQAEIVTNSPASRVLHHENHDDDYDYDYDYYGEDHICASNGAPPRRTVATLPLDALAPVWTALSALWEVVDHRREMQQTQRRSRGGGGGQTHQGRAGDGGATTGHAETRVMAQLTDYVLSDMNAVLAHRLQCLEKDKMRRTLSSASSTRAWNHDSQGPDDAVHVRALAMLARGLTEWGASVYVTAAPSHGGGGGSSSGPASAGGPSRGGGDTTGGAIGSTFEADCAA